MKLKFIKDDCLYMLKENVVNNVDNYKLRTNEWLKDFFLGEDCFITFKKEFNDFDLILPSEKENFDFENIKILYGNLKELTESQACEERLWVGLCHDKFWNYMIKRWDSSKAEEKRVTFIQKNYFFNYGSGRSLLLNGLSKLWWFGKLTYNESLEDPWELTEYICKDINGRGYLLFAGYNFSSNKRIVSMFLKTLKEFEHNERNLNRDEFKEMAKKMNLASGKFILEYLSDDELKYLINENLKIYII